MDYSKFIFHHIRWKKPSEYKGLQFGRALRIMLDKGWSIHKRSRILIGINSVPLTLYYRPLDQNFIPSYKNSVHTDQLASNESISIMKLHQ